MSARTIRSEREEDASVPRRRGRPRGSVSLTNEIAQTILGYIRAGAFDYIAAEAAGVSDRTFREWIARGEGRSARPSTDKLSAFAEDVRRAKAEARLAVEVRVYRENPALWLSRAARTKPEREGWTESKQAAGVPGEESTQSKFTDEQIHRERTRLIEVRIVVGDIVVPRCAHPRCRCPFHRRRTQEEIDADEKLIFRHGTRYGDGDER